MKRNLFLTCVLGVFFIFMSSLSFDKANVAEFLNLEPNLPEIPFNYDMEIPNHILGGSWSSSVNQDEINNQITSDGATLGRVLFYDTKLSFKNDVSCASCHEQQYAFADDVQFSKGIDDQLTERNSPNLNDISISSGGPGFFGNGGTMLFWDCRESDLETMVLQPIEHEAELGKDLDYMLEKLSDIDYYPQLFENAFGTSEVSKTRVASALSQFIRSMSSFDSKFDQVRMRTATYTAAEENGERIFVANCGSFCHGEPHFASSMPMNNGLDSVYTDEGVAQWDGNPRSIGKFKSPSLRNIEVTAPYMHDGRFATLEEVLDFYSEEVKPHPNSDFHWTGQGEDFRGFDLTDEEKADVISFLKTLTTPTLLTHEKWSDPFNEISSSDDLLLESLSIYPNPVDGQLVVDLGNLSADNVRLNLFDLNGKMMWKDQMTDTSQSFDLQKVPTGVYLLRLNVDGKVASKKLFFK